MFNGNYIGAGKATAPSSSSKGFRKNRKEVQPSKSMTETKPLKSRNQTVQRTRSGRAVVPDLREILATRPPAEVAVGLREMPSSALAAFMRDAVEVPLLSVEQEIELARQMKAGKKHAREHMIRANLRLVVKIARDYEHLGLPLLDLISEGTIGLMKAVDRFDPRKGGKLSTYAAWWIKQQIRRALANQGRTIRLPVHVEGRLYRLSRAEVKLRETLGRDATEEELSDEMGLSMLKIRRLRHASVRTASLETPVGEDGDGMLGDIVPDENCADPAAAVLLESDKSLLITLLGRLSKREYEILKGRFGLDGEQEQTLEELGDKFGLTRERIRQLQNEAFKKLREQMESNRPLQMAA